MLKNSSTQFIFSGMTTRTMESQRAILVITWTLTPDFSLKTHYQRNWNIVLGDPPETNISNSNRANQKMPLFSHKTITLIYIYTPHNVFRDYAVIVVKFLIAIPIFNGS